MAQNDIQWWQFDKREDVAPFTICIGGDKGNLAFWIEPPGQIEEPIIRIYTRLPVSSKEK